MTQHATAASASRLALILNSAAAYATRASELLAGCSLTVDRWRILELAERHDSLTMSGLATQLSMPSSTATRLVDHLVADGLLYRVIDSADRRRVLLKVTAKGRTAVSQASRELEPLETELRTPVEEMRVTPGTDAERDRRSRHLVHHARRRTTS